MIIIGINGFKRSGKGETANIIESVFNLNGLLKIEQVGFADKLKILAAKALGYLDLDDAECIELMDEYKTHGTLESKVGPFRSGGFKGISGREYLQNIGNEARGIFGSDFWVDQVLPHSVEALAARYPQSGMVLFTDLRYPNEARRVRDLGGFVVEVVRPGLKSDGHASETPLPRDLIDAVIPNDAGLEELRGEVARVVRGLLVERATTA